MHPPTLQIAPELEGSGFQFALVWGMNLSRVVSSDGVPAELSSLLAEIKAAGGASWPEGLRESVRNMLRHGKYKPTGRGKPASEFLLGAAVEGCFPLLNVPANVNNYISVASGLPASIFDASVIGTELQIRWGSAGESYVFNPSGQVIDLQDLLCIYRRSEGKWIPTGNPVKDSMASKVSEHTKSVVAVLFAPPGFGRGELEKWADRFALLLREWAGASASGFSLTVR